ncbi:hypothetical protein ACVR0O_09640 [Streptococcus caviae]|uniref:hypothetical protein n=1 Tax=Streptococcus sp. 'caviae' TaxID=1915004 RepID=UPI0015D6652C|nr:hypothetical protein [Streptococcus sp. 'caviae']
MSGLTITGICFALVGILVLIWGATLEPIDLSNPDFMSFATGGLILLAAGLCMITGLPAMVQIAGLWLAAVTTMLYIYSLPDTPLMIKVIGFVPVLALAVWLSLKFWK